jgi:outer membrane protein insertion porin family
MKIHLPAGLLAVFFATAAAAMEPFTVRDIRVEGIQRVEAGTVFSYLPVKVGETMNDEKAAQAIKTLFSTGFFKDVRVEHDGEVLIIVVEERPAIAQIDFVGLKEFDKDQLIKGLKDVGIGLSRTFDRATLEKAEQELKRQYLSRGKYAVVITTTVTPLDRNRAIVDSCDVLIACPKGPEEQRSGTWATVRYARKQKKRIVIIWPDGEVTEEKGSA